MLDAMQRELKDFAVWNVPLGSFHFWCRLLQPLDERELLDAAIRKGVVFTPGGVYGAEQGWLRLTYSWEQGTAIDEGIRRLGKVLRTI